MKTLLYHTFSNFQQLLRIVFKWSDIHVKTHMKLTILIVNSCIFLRNSVEVRVFLSLPETLIIRSYFLEGYSSVFGSSINIFSGLLKLSIHKIPKSFLDIVHKLIEMIFGLVQNIIHLKFLMIPFGKLSRPNISQLPLQLMVDVKICSESTLEVILLHTGVTALDNFYHLCAVWIEFVVA